MPAWTTAPEDIVIVTPSDHAFSRPWRFRDGVVQAAAAVESGSADVVIFGAAPTAPTAEFGWLTLGEPAGSGPVWPLRPVLSFVEKPPSDEAVRLYRAGATWNTLVAVARVRALVALLGRPQPDVVERMAEARRRPSAERQDVLTGLYRNLPASDFSRDVLTRASGLASYCWPLSAGWTDLGTPERVQQWQSHYASVWARRKPDQLRA
jgi:mannose-1-phosphate guanylyltransferase